jgi:hypothetical protein
MAHVAHGRRRGRGLAATAMMALSLVLTHPVGAIPQGPSVGGGGKSQFTKGAVETSSAGEPRQPARDRSAADAVRENRGQIRPDLLPSEQRGAFALLLLLRSFHHGVP